MYRTEIQRYRIQKYRNTEIQKYRSTEIQKYRDIGSKKEIHKYTVTQINKRSSTERSYMDRNAQTSVLLSFVVF